MPAVFVHGVPEAADLWDDLRSHLGRDDHIAVALPGFRNDLPAGFEATMDSYAGWLVAGLEALAGAKGPIDLVGHDRGGLLALRAATLRPDLLRSWVTDAASLFDPAATWHSAAKIWQSPGAGEAFMARAEAMSPAERREQMADLGVPADRADRCTLGDPVMDTCILTLYRSAVDVMHTWGSEVERAASRPGLVLVPSEDPFLQAAPARRTAQRTGARIEDLPGLGHWWVLERPQQAATLIESFWQGVRP